MEKKVYIKPSVEIMEVQWSECVAGSTTNYFTSMEVDSGSRTEQWQWFTTEGGSWDSSIF